MGFLHANGKQIAENVKSFQCQGFFVWKDTLVLNFYFKDAIETLKLQSGVWNFGCEQVLGAAFYPVPRVTQGIIYSKMIQRKSGSLPTIVGKNSEMYLCDINIAV